MILYNVTTKVDRAIAEEWLNWINEEHIPDVLATGCFSKTIIFKILELDDTDGPTYAIQYFADSKSEYERYIGNFAAVLRNKSFVKWGNQFISFRSVMEFVN